MAEARSQALQDALIVASVFHRYGHGGVQSAVSTTRGAADRIGWEESGTFWGAVHSGLVLELYSRRVAALRAEGKEEEAAALMRTAIAAVRGEEPEEEAL